MRCDPASHNARGLKPFHSIANADAIVWIVGSVERPLGRIAIELHNDVAPRTVTLNHFTEMCRVTEAGSYLRLIDSCITRLKSHGPSRTCDESKEEEELGRDPARERPSRKAFPACSLNW